MVSHVSSMNKKQILNINFQKTYCAKSIYMIYLIYRNGQRFEIQNERMIKMNYELNEKSSYYEYAKRYDENNGTQHAQRIAEMLKQRREREQMKREYESSNTQQTTHQTERVTLDNGLRNVIGNYNDNHVMIEKTFNHLNALKRSMSLSFQTDDENTKLFHENNMFRELLNLELSLRKMKTNIKNEQ